MVHRLWMHTYGIKELQFSVFIKQKSQVFVIEFHINWHFICLKHKHCQFEKKSTVRYDFLVAQTIKCLLTMRKTWVQSLGREDLLEKETATHSSILAWDIPWTPCSTPLGYHRAPRWPPCVIQQHPTSYLFYKWWCIYVNTTLSICPTLSFSWAFLVAQW